MKVTMMLAEYAQAVEDRLTIVGGGMTVVEANTVPYSIAGLFEVPWDRANIMHRFRFDLVDTDGHVIFAETDEGEAPVVIEGEFEAGRPPGLKPGTPLGVAFALNLFPPPPLEPGERYEWRLSIDGESQADWRLSFTTRETMPDEGELA